MEFVITKTSLCNDEKPCDGATYRKVDYIDARTFKTEEEFNEVCARLEGEWRSKGVDHCSSEDGGIQRRFPKGEVVWVKKISTLEELMGFLEEQKCDVILKSKGWRHGLPEIEIYDDYRE